MWLKTKETSIRLACTSHAHLSLTVLPTFPGSPGERSQHLRKCEAGCIYYLPWRPEADLALPGAGLGMSWLSGLKPKLSTCGHVWCPEVACTHATSHLTLGGPTPCFYGSLTRILLPQKGSCSCICSCTCFLPPMTQDQTQTPTARQRAITCFEVDALYLFLLLLV